mgnify:CR=1 FL=1
MKKEIDNKEEITIVDWQSKEKKYKMTFSMLLSYAKMNGNIVNFKIGAYPCILKVIDEEIECKKCGAKLE